ncbi:MAG: hypothetical protein GQ534_08630, partial [Candidatus Delongbacteria bacterium]|nr:hypothetical protein [Candidatus Delongbacteria bacterium]
SDIQLTIEPDPQIGNNPSVDIFNTKIYTSGSLKDGIYIKNAGALDIENVTIDNFRNGIVIDLLTIPAGKSSRRITNNTVTFDVGTTNKLGQQIGIQVQNTNDIEIENNNIENGDIGIEMSSSSGRITNNTVTFDVGTTNKDKLLGKIAINVISGTDVEITDNDIWIADSTSALISAINVENSSAQIYYNKINFYNHNSLVRNGIVFNDVLDSTYAYNNTIFNARKGVNNTPGFYSVDFINNIIWNDGTYSSNVDNPDSINFYNNNIEDMTGITGTGNISSDPLCIDPSTNDLVISTSSPCKNTGLAVSGFHILDTNYFGDAPEIGAVEYYEISLTAPGDATISMTDSTFTLGWSAVSGATSYDVYSSNDPYGTFTLEVNVVTTSWTDTDITSMKKFYYVIASESSKNAGYVREHDSLSKIVEDKKYKVIKKRIPKKIRRTTNLNK